MRSKCGDATVAAPHWAPSPSSRRLGCAEHVTSVSLYTVVVAFTIACGNFRRGQSRNGSRPARSLVVGGVESDSPEARVCNAGESAHGIRCHSGCGSSNPDLGIGDRDSSAPVAVHSRANLLIRLAGEWGLRIQILIRHNRNPVDRRIVWRTRTDMRNKSLRQLS